MDEVVSETVAVKILMTVDSLYNGVQMVIASMKWVPPHVRMNKPKARKHPMKGNIAFPLVSQIPQRHRDCQICESNQ
jgi:hypothetical protein